MLCWHGCKGRHQYGNPKGLRVTRLPKEVGISPGWNRNKRRQKLKHFSPLPVFPCSTSFPALPPPLNPEQQRSDGEWGLWSVHNRTSLLHPPLMLFPTPGRVFSAPGAPASSAVHWAVPHPFPSLPGPLCPA